MGQITRREFMKRAALAGSAIYLSTLPLKAIGKKLSNENKAPNLLIVFPDQMRAHTLGFMKQDPVMTPNLDAFAKESVVLTQAASNYPVCSPFRAMLMTGQYPHSNGVLVNCNSFATPFNNELSESARCWSDILKDKGYSLGYIGKWHLDSPHKPYVESYNNEKEPAWNEWCPPDRRHGFDFWYSYGTFDRHLNPMYWGTNAKRDEAHRVDQWGPEHEADLAIKYLNNEGGKYRNADKPFALVVSMNPPHSPYNQVPQKYIEMYKDMDMEKILYRKDIPPAGTEWGDFYRKNIKGYFAMVTGVDEQFGRILKSLKENCLEENTIVLFTSDHGDCLGIHDEVSKNNPYEEAMNVPFIIRYPRELKNRQDDLLISSPDIYPTLLDMMGYGDCIPDEVEGVSHAGLLQTGKGKRPSSQLYIYMTVGQPTFGRRGVRNHRYTFVMNKTTDKPITRELYDRETDPYQLENIAHQNPGLVKKMYEEELKPWLEKTKDPWLD